MSYHHTLEAAVESLHEIEVLVKNFPANGKIPAIEIDLAMQKLRNLYELILMMKENEIHVTPDHENAHKTDMVEREPYVTPEESKKSLAANVTPAEEYTASEAEQNEPPKSKPVKKETGARKEPEVQTLSDQFRGGPTLLETLSQTYKRESEDLLRSKPVTDLMSAIALNERFTFIRELFNNDKKAFESAISLLNNAGSFETAYEYVAQNNWDMEDESVQLLLGILRRKYKV